MSHHVHIASDHAGFALKSILILRLASQGHDVEDHGTHTTHSCDYPVYARALCESVLASDKGGGMGILICGTGLGMSMAANRMLGIRAALCVNEFQARAARQHNNANVLCLGECVVGSGLAFALVQTFLDTPFEGGRHQRRVDILDVQK